VNVYFKTAIIKPNIKIILTAGVPSSQVLPGFLITAPPSMCVSVVLGVLAVWIQNQYIYIYIYIYRHVVFYTTVFLLPLSATHGAIMGYMEPGSCYL